MFGAQAKEAMMKGKALGRTSGLSSAPVSGASLVEQCLTALLVTERETAAENSGTLADGLMGWFIYSRTVYFTLHKLSAILRGETMWSSFQKVYYFLFGGMEMLAIS